MCCMEPRQNRTQTYENKAHVHKLMKESHKQPYVLYFPKSEQSFCAICGLNRHYVDKKLS